MFSKADIDGSFTNYSLRATGVSNLFSSGIPEALIIIQKHSGHRSTEALRLYETHGVENRQTQAISNILASEASNYQSEFDKRDLSPQEDQLFIDLAKSLDEQEMDDEKFIDKFGSKSDI